MEDSEPTLSLNSSQVKIYSGNGLCGLSWWLRSWDWGFCSTQGPLFPGTVNSATLHHCLNHAGNKFRPDAFLTCGCLSCQNWKIKYSSLFCERVRCPWWHLHRYHVYPETRIKMLLGRAEKSGLTADCAAERRFKIVVYRILEPVPIYFWQSAWKWATASFRSFDVNSVGIVCLSNVTAWKWKIHKMYL